MKTIIAAFLLLTSACFGQAIASRRYAELTPEQYVFGPLTAVAPFNAAPNHSTAVDSQVQPPNLITSNEQFNSTSDFTVINGSATFTVAGNVGTFAVPSATEYIAGVTATSFAAPYMFIETEVNQNGAAGSIFIGVSNTANTTRIMVGFNTASTCFGWTWKSGTYTNFFGSIACTMPSTPWYIGMSLVGGSACLWVKTSTTWSMIGCGSPTAQYDPTVSGNLTGFVSAVRLATGVASTWQLSNFKTGGFGGIGVRDISLVTYADGRPYMEGPVAYFTTTTCDPSSSCEDAVYSYDVVSKALTQIGAIFNNRSGHIYNDVASHLVFDSGLNEYRYMVGGWGSSSSPPTYYGAWLRSTCDPLQNEVCIAPASTQMTFTSGPPDWDAHFSCSQWNYSTLTCGKWIVGAASTNTTQFANSSTSDPSANTWTSIGSTSTHWAEGDRILRTATGSSGVTYEFVYANAQTGNLVALNGRENTLFPAASSSSFGSIGSLTAQIPGGAQNPPHPQIFSYDNTEYLVTFNDVLWGTTSNTMGDWLVATAPKYSAQPTYPQFVSGTSAFSGGTSVASETTSAVTVTSGDLVVAYCRGGNTAATSVALSSSVAMGAFSSPGFDLISSGSGTGYGQAFYGFATAGGSSTFTCTPSTSSTFQGVTVMVFHPGNLTTADYVAIANQTGSSNAVYTSPSFSTTAKGLIVVCADGLFGAGNFVPGFIGPYASGPANGLSSGAAACMSTVTDAAQTGITANMGTTSGNSAQWGGAILSFK